jgi:hypothetical protein
MKKIAKYTVITIDAVLHEEVRKYCDENGIKIGFFAKQALQKLLQEKYVTTQSSVRSDASTHKDQPHRVVAPPLARYEAEGVSTADNLRLLKTQIEPTIGSR